MTRARTILAICALLLTVILAGLWLARLRIATDLVDDRLTAAGVPARYRITRIGPFLERMEDVRIGDPAHPDLIARRIDVAIGYGLRGPIVTGVVLDGVRLRARLDDRGIHLGALDRLLPQSKSGAIRLPDLDVDITGSRLALDTPNGAITIAVAGTGNPARRFRGTATGTAPTLRLASCALRDTRAELVIGADAGRPRVDGPITIGGTDCAAFRLGRGTARVAASSNETFERITLDAVPGGFAGVAGQARFTGVRGTIRARGALGKLAVQAELGLDHLALPRFAGMLRSATALPAGLPVTPTVHAAAQAVARLLDDARAEASLHARIVGTQVAVRVHRASLAGANGARLVATENGGMSWSAEGWRTDGDVILDGGMLSQTLVKVRQRQAGAPIVATGHVAPYRAGPASLALPDFHVMWDGTTTRFAADLAIDGPLGDGFVHGLAMPIEGRLAPDGGIVIGEGCRVVGATALKLIGFTFRDVRTRLCGQPIVTRAAGGAIRIDAATGPIRLVGSTGSGAPVTLDLAHARVTESGFAIDAVAATVGESRLDIARLEGRIARSLTGIYRGATGSIANVPLALSDGEGEWSFAGGALILGGALRIADAAPDPRFLPLRADDLRLTLRGGIVDVTATLHEPVTHARIADVALTHSLAAGTGHATLAVPGILFAPKRLQPEALTPLTLGVVANVAGTISGAGRIDWSAGGVTSSGTFGSDRLDLAAAFGPVSGISGRIAFTDLLGLVSAPHQEIRITELNPGVAVADGVVHLQMVAGNRVRIEDAAWPFATGQLRLDPTTLDFSAAAERRLTFRIDGLDAAAFVQQLDFPNLAATGTFDGVLPIVFDARGGRIEDGALVARRQGGTIAYVGEVSRANIGSLGKLAFDALKAIRYSALAIHLDGRLEGEMISRIDFTGVQQATPGQSLVTRLLRDLPFRFNIRIRAPFRGLVGSARAYIDPRLLLNQSIVTPPPPAVRPRAIQPPATRPVP